MIFWVGILIGGLFAWLALKMGFYLTWAMLFNIVISVYLAVFLGPIIIDYVPGAADTPYSNLLAMISTAIGAFLILHCISYTFLTGQFNVSFPRIVDSLGTVVLGFLAGFLVWSFVIILISTTPISQYKIAKGLGFGGQSQQTSLSTICWWCDLVHGAVGSEDNKVTSKEIVNGLLKSAESKMRYKPDRKAEPNEPSTADTENI